MGMYFRIFQDDLCARAVEIWNRSATDWHGYNPLTPELFEAHIIRSGRFRAENFLFLERNGETVGWVHYDIVDVPPYPRCGVICALMVVPELRCQGLGEKLLQEALFRLQRQGARQISGLGAWPYSPFYGGLIDGSERAGVPDNQRGMIWLLDKMGFSRMRTSHCMRADLAAFRDGLHEGEQAYYQSRAGKDTWLDYVFRRWELFDHALLSAGGEVLSRAIHARMSGLCEQEGREIHAVFGVNTPTELRGKGHALRNLQVLFARLSASGAQEAELHVYADNAPALGLYEKLGFRRLHSCFDMLLR